MDGRGIPVQTGRRGGGMGGELIGKVRGLRGLGVIIIIRPRNYCGRCELTASMYVRAQGFGAGVYGNGVRDRCILGMLIHGHECDL